MPVIRQKIISSGSMVSVLQNNKKSLALVFATWGILFSWLWPHMFYQTSEGIFAGVRTVWADWAAHMTYLKHMEFHTVSDWFTHHPLYYLERFNYPFVANLISLVLHKLGLSLTQAFVLPSILTTYFLLLILIVFFSLHMKSPLRILLCISLFFLSGGMGFLEYIRELLHPHHPGFFSFPKNEYTNLTPYNIHLMNILTYQLIPQRAFLLGLPIGLSILYRFSKWRDLEFNDVSSKQKILWGLLFGLLVIVHPHTTLALGIILIVYGIFSLRFFSRWSLFAVTAFISTLVLYFIFIKKINGASFFGPSIGWLARGGFLEWIYFWWLNGGIFLLLAIYGTIRFKQWKNPAVVSGWTLFILCNLFKFSPWEWDNTKIFSWAWLLLCIPASETICRLFKRPHWSLKTGALLLTLFSVSAGVLEVSRLFFHKRMAAQMWSEEDLRMTQSIQDLTTTNDLFLIEPNDFQNFISRLSGRPILMGYTPTLWSYGFNYHSVEEEITKMLAGSPEALELLQKYKITHAVLRKGSKDFQFNFDFFSQHFTRILSNERYAIYRIKK